MGKGQGYIFTYAVRCTLKVSWENVNMLVSGKWFGLNDSESQLQNIQIGLLHYRDDNDTETMAS